MPIRPKPTRLRAATLRNPQPGERLAPNPIRPRAARLATPRGPVRRFLPLALAALLALTLLPGLRAVGPLDWREARDAVVAGESARGGEGFGPTYANEPLFEKPLAGYAHELLAQRLLPRRWRPEPGDAGASRLVRAAFAAALALVVAAIGTRAFGARAGWLAACALASSLGLPLAARADGGQLLATLCSWLGAGGLLAAARGRPRGGTLVLFTSWLSLGVATVSGGPLSALWPLAGFGLYAALARAHGPWRALRPVEGLAIVAAVALPWYGMMTALYGGAFLARVPWFPYALDSRVHWLAAPLAALSFVVVIGFPWTALLGAALRDAADRLRGAGRDGPADLRESGHAASLVLALGVAAAVPVALYPAPPLTAALPALPAIALLCGRFLDRVLEGDVDPRHLTRATWMSAFLGTTTAALGVVIAGRVGDATHGLRLVSAVVLVTSWTPLLADLTGRRRLAAALFALPVALGAPLVTTRVLPELEPWLSTRAAAAAMAARSPADAPLVLTVPAPPSLRLLLPRNLVTLPGLARALEAAPSLAAADGYTYVAVRGARALAALRSAAPGAEVLAGGPSLTLVRVPAIPAVPDSARSVTPGATSIPPAP